MLDASEKEAPRATLKPLGLYETWLILALLIPFWALFQLVYFAYQTLSGGFNIRPGSSFLADLWAYAVQPAELAIIGSGAIICYAMYVVLGRLRRAALWQQLAAACVTATLAAGLFSLTIAGLCKLFGVPWPPLTVRFFLADSLRWLAPFGLWAGIALTVTYSIEARARERRFWALGIQAREAQLSALRHQINPHFLYNTLNSISALILDRRNAHADDMVIKLSNYLRMSLATEGMDVTLDQEITLQTIYLEIQKVRFEDRLHVRIEVPADLRSVLVPSFILQPLVENVVKHGLGPPGTSTDLGITARAAGDRLVIEVANNGPGSGERAVGTGIGLRNVRERLMTRYGSDHVFKASTTNGGFLVRMEIPLRKAAQVPDEVDPEQTLFFSDGLTAGQENHRHARSGGAAQSRAMMVSREAAVQSRSGAPSGK